MLIEKFRNGEDESARTRKLNALVEAVSLGGKLAVGPGLNLFQGPGGTAISISKDILESVRKSTADTEDATDPLVEMGYGIGVTDADTWDLSSKTAVKVWVVTDLTYDETTLQYKCAFRPLLISLKGRVAAIGAEEAWIVWTSAELCP